MDDYSEHSNLPSLSVTSARENQGQSRTDKSPSFRVSDEDNAVGEMSDSSSCSSSSDSDSDPDKTVIRRPIVQSGGRNSTNGYHATKVSSMPPTNNIFDDLQLSEESD